MTPKKFSEAMKELDNKYVNEAASYKKKGRKPAWVKWGVAAACFSAIFLAGIFALRMDDMHWGYRKKLQGCICCGKRVCHRLAVGI